MNYLTHYLHLCWFYHITLTGAFFGLSLLVVSIIFKWISTPSQLEQVTNPDVNMGIFSYIHVKIFTSFGPRWKKYSYSVQNWNRNNLYVHNNLYENIWYRDLLKIYFWALNKNQAKQRKMFTRKWRITVAKFEKKVLGECSSEVYEVSAIF